MYSVSITSSKGKNTLDVIMCHKCCPFDAVQQRNLQAS